MREAALAFHLTRKWSKEKILTEYLNSIYFGNGAYGIESAARTYFGIQHDGCGRGGRRCASELTPAEAALLAGVVVVAERVRPGREPRRRRRSGATSSSCACASRATSRREEYQRGIEEALPAQDRHPPALRAARTARARPTSSSWVRQQLVDRYGARRAFEGGLRISTTLDLKLQEAAEQAVNAWLSEPGGPQASLVAIDNDTGEVRAMVGGRRLRRRSRSTSPRRASASRARRSSRSCSRPRSSAGISPGSVWASQASATFTVPGTSGKEKFVVNNYEGNYLGSASLAAATALSDNSVYVRWA